MDSDQYQAPELATGEKRYRLSLFWVNNRQLIKNILLGIWAVVDALLIIFALWVMIDTFLISYQNERALLASMGINQVTRYQNIHGTLPETLEAETEASVFVLGDGRYDFYSTITNDNLDYWVQFDYYFTFGTEQTDRQSGFILPDETKPLVELAHTSVSRPTNAELVIENLDWNYVDPHTIADYESWRDQRMNFVVTDAVYTPELENFDNTVGRSTFTIKNNGAFAFWEPEFYVVLYRGSSAVAVTKTLIAEFEPGQSRTIEQNWFGSIPSITKLEVIPEIDLFDASVYMPLVGETEEDLRDRIFD